MTAARVMHPLRLLGLCALLGLCGMWQSRAIAQNFDFRAPTSPTDPAAAALMRDLASRILPVYEETDPERYLANLSALQMVVGDYRAAFATRQSLDDRRRAAEAGKPVNHAVVYDIYARARAMEARDRMAFASAFTQSYHDALGRLSDPDAYIVTGWLGTPAAVFEDALQKALEPQRGKRSIALPAAVDLIWAYLAYDAYRAFSPVVATLSAQEDRRRYDTEQDVRIKTRSGVSISARLVRPRLAGERLPTLLEFSIDVDGPNYAKEAAAHGYVGVVAYARGKGQSDGEVVPYEYDGDDARAVINWIARQPWSDGRVGMYGTGYSGFTAWAAAKHLPSALKAIATSSSTAPGVDFPMRGHIYRNSAYRWAAYVTNAADEKAYNDEAKWRALDETWYMSGRRYRDLDMIYGKNVHIFRRWLNHPSYDLYWQKMVPFREQFAHIDIPVLAIAGYYGIGEIGALYYFTQHHHFDPHADHTLVIGPYDDNGTEQAAPAMLRGYGLDAVALIDLRELRYQWFDYVLKGAAKPALLQDRVNYQLMGANEWRHAPTLEAMASGTLRFYLQGAASGEQHRLTQRKPPEAKFVRQIVDLADRSDASWRPQSDIVSRNPVGHNSLTFVSDPLPRPIEVSGLPAGRLDFAPDKMDVDLNIALFELLANGDYVQLSNPYEIRASYARDPLHRHLLKAGERQQLAWKSQRLTARRLQAGSRIVLVLVVNKRADQEINYGAGDDVSEESIDDGTVPLRIRWYGGTYLDLPVRR